MAKEKTECKKLKEKLLESKKNGFLRMSDEQVKKCDKFCEGYKKFLDIAKTEREAVSAAIAEAEKNGFTAYSDDRKLSAGDKIYYNNRGKAIILAVIGSESINN